MKNCDKSTYDCAHMHKFQPRWNYIYSTANYATARSRTHLKKILAQLFGDITLPLMEPEDSLPCSQQSTTGLYPEPEEYSFYPGILFL